MNDEAEPRWLNPVATGKYISVRPDALSRLVREGRIPKPTYGLGPRSPRWDRLLLDDMFCGGTSSTNIDMVVEAIAQDILAHPRRRRAKRDGQ